MVTHPARARSPTGSRSWSRVLLTVGVPVAFGGLLLAHPLVMTDASGLSDIAEQLGHWYVVHYGMLFFLPLLAAAGWVLVDGLPGLAARIARWSLLPFLVFLAAWEALTGIGTAWLVESAHALPPEGREVVMPVVVDWWESLNSMHWLALIGIGAWLVFGVSAAVAHRRAGSGWLVVAGLALGSLFAAGHGSLPGAIPLFALAAAGWKLSRPVRPEPT
jgi:hypothetical protein